MQHDWSRFTQKMLIKAPVEEIYNCWSTRSGMEYWFLRMAEFSRPDGTVLDDDEAVSAGDHYRWRWHGYPDDVTETGQILEANGEDRISFVFGKAGVVDVLISSAPNGYSELILTQREIPTDEEGKVNFHIGCSRGWTWYRANLKSLLEGGIDLRNKNNDDHSEDFA